MVNIKTFQYSDSLIWGLQVKIDMDKCDSNRDIIEEAKIQTIDFLKKFNLQLVYEKFIKLNYDIHEEFGNLLLDKDIGYICSHYKCSH